MCCYLDNNSNWGLSAQIRLWEFQCVFLQVSLQYTIFLHILQLVKLFCIVCSHCMQLNFPYTLGSIGFALIMRFFCSSMSSLIFSLCRADSLSISGLWLVILLFLFSDLICFIFYHQGRQPAGSFFWDKGLEDHSFFMSFLNWMKSISESGSYCCFTPLSSK